MTEYELINPSDPYTFLAKTKESAALAVFLLGTMYGASPKDDDEEKRIPVFLFGGAEEWYQEEFGRKMCIRDREPAIQQIVFIARNAGNY